MRIQIFPPIAFLIVVAMLFAALKPGLERAQAWRAVLKQVPEAGLIVDGGQLDALVVADRASVELAGPVNVPYAVMGSTGFVTDADINGVHYFLPPEVVRILRGREVELAFDVRTPDRESAGEEWMARAVIYGVLDTGWTRLPASPEWTAAAMRVVVPEGVRYDPMVIMMWSDAKGDGRRLELRGIQVTPLDAPPEGA